MSSSQRQQHGQRNNGYGNGSSNSRASHKTKTISRRAQRRAADRTATNGKENDNGNQMTIIRSNQVKHHTPSYGGARIHRMWPYQQLCQPMNDDLYRTYNDRQRLHDRVTKQRYGIGSNRGNRVNGSRGYQWITPSAAVITEQLHMDHDHGRTPLLPSRRQWVSTLRVVKKPAAASVATTQATPHTRVPDTSSLHAAMTAAAARVATLSSTQAYDSDDDEDDDYDDDDDDYDHGSVGDCPFWMRSSWYQPYQPTPTGYYAKKGLVQVNRDIQHEFNQQEKKQEKKRQQQQKQQKKKQKNKKSMPDDNNGSSDSNDHSNRSSDDQLVAAMDAMNKEKKVLDHVKAKAELLLSDYHHRIASLGDRMKHAPTITTAAITTSDTIVPSSSSMVVSMDEHGLRKATGATKYHAKSTLVSKSRRKPNYNSHNGNDRYSSMVKHADEMKKDIEWAHERWSRFMHEAEPLMKSSKPLSIAVYGDHEDNKMDNDMTLHERWVYPVGRALLMNERSFKDQQIAAAKAITTAAIIARTTINNSIATLTNNANGDGHDGSNKGVCMAASVKHVRDGMKHRRHGDGGDDGDRRHRNGDSNQSRSMIVTHSIARYSRQPGLAWYDRTR